MIFFQHLLLSNINCLQLSWSHPLAPAHSVTFHGHKQQHYPWKEALQSDRSSVWEAPTDHSAPTSTTLILTCTSSFNFCSFLNPLREFSFAFFFSTQWDCYLASLFEHQINSHQVVFLQYKALSLGGGETELLLFWRCKLTVMILLQFIFSSIISSVLALPIKKNGAGSAVKSSTPNCMCNHTHSGLKIPVDYQTACTCSSGKKKQKLVSSLYKLQHIHDISIRNDK